MNKKSSHSLILSLSLIPVTFSLHVLTLVRSQSRPFSLSQPLNTVVLSISLTLALSHSFPFPLSHFRSLSLTLSLASSLSLSHSHSHTVSHLRKYDKFISTTLSGEHRDDKTRNNRCTARNYRAQPTSYPQIQKTLK